MFANSLTGFEKHGDSIFAEFARDDKFKIDAVATSYWFLTIIIRNCPDFFAIAEAHAKVFKNKAVTKQIYIALRRGMELPVDEFRKLIEQEQSNCPAEKIKQILAWGEENTH